MKNTIFAILAMFILVAGFASATVCNPTPAVVTGTVYDQSNAVVPNADVTVTCGTAAPQSTQTDAFGDYYVVFNSCDCPYLAPIYGEASTETASGSAEGQMCSEEKCDIPIGILDITIPEFGVVAGALALLAGIGIVAYRRQ